MIHENKMTCNPAVAKAYNELFNQIDAYPKALRSAWLSGMYRTLEHYTVLEQLAAIAVYSMMAAKARQKYAARHGQS